MLAATEDRAVALAVIVQVLAELLLLFPLILLIQLQLALAELALLDSQREQADRTPYLIQLHQQVAVVLDIQVHQFQAVLVAVDLLARVALAERVTRLRFLLHKAIMAELLLLVALTMELVVVVVLAPLVKMALQRLAVQVALELQTLFLAHR